MDRAVREATILLAQKVVLRTPVGDVNGGTLRANWQFQAGSYSTKVTDDKDPSEQGLAVLARLTPEIAASPVGGRVYLSNNLPYAYRIEYEGWSHTKAPAGMVRIALAEMPAAIEKRLKELS